MASSSCHNSIPLATLLEWYKIRDTLFGENFVGQDVSLAVHLAASCNHPDADRLAKWCFGKRVRTREVAIRVFSSLDQNDPCVLCFTWMFGDRRDLTLLRRSAELGFAFAQALLAGKTQGEERFKFAQLAAAQGERDGFFQLGSCFRLGQGCEKSLDKAKDNFLRAQALGCVSSLELLGLMLDESDPKRWKLWGQAAARGNSLLFLGNFSKQVQLWNSGAGSIFVVFAIGRALQGHVNDRSRTIFNAEWNFHVWINAASRAIEVFKIMSKNARRAVDAWSIVGIRFGVVKDVRKLIAKLIWYASTEGR